jgi:RimJ/RimL family protein N-acetyltransferase
MCGAARPKSEDLLQDETAGNLRPVLTFRPLRQDDVDSVHRLHGDPATNTYNPYGASIDLQESAAMTARWVQHWERYGFGYELAFHGEALAGIAGARTDTWKGQAVLNLYWRLLPEFQGLGLSNVLAERALQISAAGGASRLRVARMLPDNVASVRVAASAGLVRRVDLDGELDGSHWILFADRPAK